MNLHTSDARTFWDYLDELIASSELVIDRPKGATHPRYPGQVYPLDYGYLSKTTSSDGAELDFWRGSLADPKLDALLLTADLRKRDAEIKLLLGCSAVEKQQILGFTNAELMRATLIERQPGLDWLQKRRSVRRFRPDPLPADLLNQVLEAATWAPSAHHRQPWRFAVLTGSAAKEHLAEAMGAVFFTDLIRDDALIEKAQEQVERSRSRIQEAPAAIVLCCDTATGDAYPDQARQQYEHWMAIQGVAMAGQNMLLAAERLGLGAVWLCSPLFAQTTIQDILSLPANWEPVGMILLGYPAVTPLARPRRPVAELARFYSE